MPGFIKLFIGYILLFALIMVASVIFIEDTNILLSIILVELLIFLIGLFYAQMVFVGIRQKYTTEKMTKTISPQQIEQLSYKNFDADYKKEQFTLSLIKDVHIFHKLFDVAAGPVSKKPFLVSHLWIDHPISIEQVVDFHQTYSIDQYQNSKIKVAVLVTFMKDTKKNDNFMKTIIYDTSRKMSYYHIPVLITGNNVFLYDTQEYALNNHLANIIEHLNQTIKEKKLEF